MTESRWLNFGKIMTKKIYTNELSFHSEVPKFDLRLGVPDGSFGVYPPFFV